VTGDYRRVAGLPLTHHIPELFAYFFLGQLLKVFFISEPFLSQWWLVPILIVMSIFTYRFAPGFAARFDCPMPRENRILKPVALLFLDAAALLGFFVVLIF
jgi:hypothetical protein